MFFSILDSPIGQMVIEANEQEICAVSFPDELPLDSPNELSEAAKEQFREYFEEKRTYFDFPIAQPGTAFQQKVWNELRKIDAGKPITYAALAKRMKSPLAIRAIALANGRNNLMIVIPCHRVIGSNGDLVGFSAGLWRKKWLLEHEARMTSMGQSVLFVADQARNDSCGSGLQ
ncbi:MAG: methylated-DNA--[protein]-cysteine S-methyltransferase [Daejeonella sp.]|uniref:methylated-DNA--[protein]-cysteine S-methyltransferase n=1 Tax=Daejeonella sp. TaxID=2805397 RepID=UPI002734CBFD|nr:methylated-DNA--[protein]-cysteine S-methyltransferase [Daejeonella sp.]MDP3468907.1 methylated-DNA--[protein]-cysteine S-methyltransferase [Daejeonella sp.]